MQIPTEFIEILRETKRLTILTGAGISAESGIPTFRDPLTGIWSKYSPEDLCSIQGFQADPTKVTRWHDELRLNMLKCEPNAAHHALVQMEEQFNTSGREFRLITQNIDGMHQRAGSQHVIEMHGSLLHWRTLDGSKRRPCLNQQPFESYPPRSGDAILRPDIIWFGEMLDHQVMRACDQAVEETDLFIAIGTSGVVAPASTFMGRAHMMGIPTALINLDDAANSYAADFFIQGKAGEILSSLIDCL